MLTSKDKSIAQAQPKTDGNASPVKSDLATKMDLERFLCSIVEKVVRRRVVTGHNAYVIQVSASPVCSALGSSPAVLPHAEVQVLM